jgi:hypothetical protein
VAPWPTARRAQTRSILHQLLNRFFLSDLGDERNLFCPLTAAEMDQGRPATMRWLGRSSTVVGASSDGALARGTALAVTATVGAPPPSSGSVREDSVRRLSSRTLGDQWQLNGGRQGHQGGASIYRGKEGDYHVRARESIPN